MPNEASQFKAWRISNTSKVPGAVKKAIYGWFRRMLRSLPKKRRRENKFAKAYGYDWLNFGDKHDYRSDYNGLFRQRNSITITVVMDMRPEMINFTNEIPVKAYVRAGCQYPYHWHNTLEVLQVLKGSVYIGIGDENLLLCENDIAVINIDEFHRIAKTQEDNKILFIQIDGRFCRSVLPDNEYLFFYCCSTYHEAQVPEKYRTVKEYIIRLLRVMIEKPDRELKKNIERLLAAMLSYISYNFDFLRWGYGTTPFNEKLVKRFKQIAIHASSDLDVRLRLKELAAEAGVSLKHLSSDIKDRFGLTFQELLYYGKCVNASKLLLNTNKRIIDIALECGFSDAKYFVKYFRHFFHCIPSEFREKHQVDLQTLTAQVEYRDCPLSDALIQK
ncbi:MAG: AraC family transcriptional regulator [Desulfotomaculaceae bacterium]|nr:AraC family transcriptional regulator [Desulfotomaculaceae bacterium]